MSIRENRRNRRDNLLDSLSRDDQIGALKWAEKNNIQSNDPAWLLVEMLGYTERMTDSLPNRMLQAGQQAVEAIEKQRKAETDAFTYNAYITLQNMMHEIAEKVAEESEKITEIKLKRKLLSQSLFAITSVISLSTVCIIFGYLFGSSDIFWLTNPSQNILIKFIQVICGAPIGFIIIPLLIYSILFLLFHKFRSFKS